jgi:5-methylcytosine-specific restriction endonuclease McrA
MPRSPGRTGRPYRRLVENVKRRGAPCIVCGKPIDLTLPATDPLSFTLEHIQPLRYGGHPLDPSNAAGSHRLCNGRKGTKSLAAVRPLPASREW